MKTNLFEHQLLPKVYKLREIIFYMIIKIAEEHFMVCKKDMKSSFNIHKWSFIERQSHHSFSYCLWEAFQTDVKAESLQHRLHSLWKPEYLLSLPLENILSTHSLHQKVSDFIVRVLWAKELIGMQAPLDCVWIERVGCVSAFLKSCTTRCLCYCLHKPTWWRGSGSISYFQVAEKHLEGSWWLGNQHILGTAIFLDFIMKFKNHFITEIAKMLDREGIPAYMMAISSNLKKENKPTLSTSRYTMGDLIWLFCCLFLQILFASICSLSLLFLSNVT